MENITAVNKQEQVRFQNLIEKRLADLESENTRGQDGSAVVELDQQAIGRLSRMDALQMQAMAQAQQARRNSEADRLQSALARLADDTYGECEDCGEDIAPKRLELNLTTTLCISCARG